MPSVELRPAVAAAGATILDRWRGAPVWLREPLVLIAASLVVQLLVPYRFDLPAHVAAGGGVALLAAVVLGPGIARRASAVFPVLVVGVAAVAAFAAESAVLGPFDLVDLVFSLLGSLLVTPSAEDLAALPVRDRLRLAAAAMTLVAFALQYRYGPGVGRW